MSLKFRIKKLENMTPTKHEATPLLLRLYSMWRDAQSNKDELPINPNHDAIVWWNTTTIEQKIRASDRRKRERALADINYPG